MRKWQGECGEAVDNSHGVRDGKRKCENFDWHSNVAFAVMAKGMLPLGVL